MLFFPHDVELVVHVQDARGQPVDGVAVMFQVESNWKRHTTVTPQHATTHDGIARTILHFKRTGVVRVCARVENLTKEHTLTVSTSLGEDTPPW